jgi:hypothetical protein
MKLRGFVTALLAGLIGWAGLQSVRDGAVVASDAVPAAAVDPATPARKVDFNRDVLPILSDNCFTCHGPDQNKRKADLRLDTKEGLFAKLDGYTIVVPGSLDDSVMWMRVDAEDEEVIMPPPHKSGKKLSDAQKELIRLWIEQGAQWEGHWSFIKPVQPPVPSVDGNGFVRNEIDRFILAHLDQRGVKPSPEADRVTLIRRLSFDLTGLPPTPQEVDAFVNDQSPGAYDALVSRLMASPHFGERMAVYWLDLVRYADTIGYHSDNPREVHPYRDYVIRSFNENKPFDQFTIENLAGDLLPEPTVEQKIASGYNRLLLTTGEGGAQAKEYIVKYAADRVRNVSAVWMGATMACAECHDHKYDPFSQKDFYTMAAFFADIQEKPIQLPEPELMLPTEREAAEIKRLDEALTSARKSLDVTTPEIAAAQSQWEQQIAKDRDAVKWTPLQVTEASSANGVTLALRPDDSILALGANPPTDVYTVKGTVKLKKVTALRIEALSHRSFNMNGPGRAHNGNFVLTEIDVHADRGAGPTSRPVAFQAASASIEQSQVAERSVYGRWPAVAAIDGDKHGENYGWAILPRVGQPSHAVFETAVDIGQADELALTVVMKQNLGEAHTLGRFRLSVTDAPRPVRAIPDRDVPGDVLDLLAIDASKRTDDQKARISAHFRSISPLLQPIREQIAKLEKDKAAVLESVTRTLISVSGEPRVTRVLTRGDWMDESGQVVQPAVPHFMKQVESPADRRATRLDLARWMVDKDNPLTARVFVNRIWKLFYGQGIAKHVDDLGLQGEPPSHPQLLDYLATDFIESGWDVKRLVRLIVTSGTYRQSSKPTPQLREQDPYNRLLARQGRFRLDAEFVRDNALAVSGLLVSTIGGPSVKPYQPAGYWEFLNFPKRTYRQDTGEKLYRRGMYTHWQRMFLHPSLAAFDAPSREDCTADRTRSNTPQQALTLLNDPTYVEAARVFAERIITDGGASPQQRLTYAFRRALSRSPNEAEADVLVELMEKHRAEYGKDRESALSLTGIGEYRLAKGIDPAELAAWTSVSRVILNLHETITRN